MLYHLIYVLTCLSTDLNILWACILSDFISSLNLFIVNFVPNYRDWTCSSSLFYFFDPRLNTINWWFVREIDKNQYFTAFSVKLISYFAEIFFTTKVPKCYMKRCIIFSCGVFIKCFNPKGSFIIILTLVWKVFAHETRLSCLLVPNQSYFYLNCLFLCWYIQLFGALKHLFLFLMSKKFFYELFTLNSFIINFEMGVNLK